MGMRMKRMFYSMNTTKKFTKINHTTFEHWQNWRENFKIIHNESVETLVKVEKQSLGLSPA